MNSVKRELDSLGLDFNGPKRMCMMHDGDDGDEDNGELLVPSEDMAYSSDEAMIDSSDDDLQSTSDESSSSSEEEEEEDEEYLAWEAKVEDSEHDKMVIAQLVDKHKHLIELGGTGDLGSMDSHKVEFIATCNPQNVEFIANSIEEEILEHEKRDPDLQALEDSANRMLDMFEVVPNARCHLVDATWSMAVGLDLGDLEYAAGETESFVEDNNEFEPFEHMEQLDEDYNHAYAKLTKDEIEHLRELSTISGIRKEQASTDLIVPINNMQLLIQEIGQDFPNIGFTKNAIDALHCIGETYVREQLENGNLVAQRGGTEQQERVDPRHLQCSRALIQ
jgi:histone H3/H4